MKKGAVAGAGLLRYARGNLGYRGIAVRVRHSWRDRVAMARLIDRIERRK